MTETQYNELEIGKYYQFTTKQGLEYVGMLKEKDYFQQSFLFSNIKGHTGISLIAVADKIFTFDNISVIFENNSIKTKKRFIFF